MSRARWSIPGCTATTQGGARFANSGGGGTADGLHWVGGGFRKNGVAGLILGNGARDMSVQGAYFVDNYGAWHPSHRRHHTGRADRL